MTKFLPYIDLFETRRTIFESPSNSTFSWSCCISRGSLFCGARTLAEKMVRRRKPLSMGKGAEVSIYLRFLHPTQQVRPDNVTFDPRRRVTGMVLRKDTVIINGKEQVAIFINSDNVFPNGGHMEVYACKNHFTVIKEGLEEDFFQEVVHAVEPLPPDEEFPDEVLEVIAARNENGNADVFDAIFDVEVDNDNDPAPENIPDDNAAVNGCIYNANWGNKTICYRKETDVSNNRAKLLNIPQGHHPDLVHLFELFFPKKFVEDVVLPNLNERVERPVRYGEFLRFIGIFFLIATVEGPHRRDFWSLDPVTLFDGAPIRIDFMSRNRFEEILYGLKFTTIAPPNNYNDKFFHVRELVQAFNRNIAENFSPSWISCLDESMMEWTSKYTCPGFMFVLRKPHPFGNEWHSICCGHSGIMFAVELVEGRDHPPNVPIEFDEKGKTVGLLLRLTRSIWHTGKVVILDSGFCVLAGITALREHGVFASALTKKRRYWPKHINGAAILEHFHDKAIGSVDSIGGKLNNVKFDIFCMKDAGYTIIMMSSYGTNALMGSLQSRRVNGELISIQYPEVVRNHYTYRHAVDDHNARRHAPISFERRWGTKSWASRVFSFLLAVTEVNVMLADAYFKSKKTEVTLEFRKKFAEALICNKYYLQENLQVEDLRRSIRILPTVGHRLKSVPKKHTFFAGELVQCQTTYSQRQCIGCHCKVRTYCTCTPGIYRCPNCYGDHRAFTR
jgi:Transposase IS4